MSVMQAIPCLLLALIAKPGTHHKLVFRVRPSSTRCAESALVIVLYNKDFCIHACMNLMLARFFKCTSCVCFEMVDGKAPITLCPNLAYACRFCACPGIAAVVTAFAGHVGHVCLHGISLCSATTTDDAKSKGRGEVHSALRLCAGHLAIHQLCTLDLTNSGW